MATKKTLLQIVQTVLENIDGENVNSISDTVEAQQIASFIEQTFFNIINNRDYPEHYDFFVLDAASDSNNPTKFTIPDNIKQICNMWYMVDATTKEYRELDEVDILTFVQRSDSLTGSSHTNITINGTNVKVFNDRHPSYFTVLEDNVVIMDAYKSSVDNTLQESKIRCYGIKHPVFTISDSFVPNIDLNLFPFLISESTSMAFDLLKGGVSPKIEQISRRNQSRVQNDKYRTNRRRTTPSYGRT
jgi:hypothetical protein